MDGERPLTYLFPGRGGANPASGVTTTSLQYNHEILFFSDPEIIDFRGLDGPGALDTTPKGGALRALPFGVVSGAPGAVQTPKIDDFWVPGKYVSTIILIRSGD